MATVIVIHRPDGGVSILRPTNPARFDAAREVEKWAASYGVSPTLPFSEVDDSQLPTGAAARKFRNAWIFSGGSVIVDLVEARAMRELELRDELWQELQALRDDIETAEDAGDSARAAALRAQRAAIRFVDHASALRALRTPEEIAAYTGRTVGPAPL